MIDPARTLPGSFLAQALVPGTIASVSVVFLAQIAVPDRALPLLPVVVQGTMDAAVPALTVTIEVTMPVSYPVPRSIRGATRLIIAPVLSAGPTVPVLGMTGLKCDSNPENGHPNQQEIFYRILNGRMVKVKVQAAMSPNFHRV